MRTVKDRLRGRASSVGFLPETITSLRPTATARADGTAFIPRRFASRAWLAIVPAAIVLVLLVVFVLQNLNQVTVHLGAASTSLPVGLALLLAAVFGGLVVFSLGSVRIVQLRRLLRRRAATEAHVEHALDSDARPDA